MKRPLTSASLLLIMFLSIVCSLHVFVNMTFAVTQITIDGDMIIPPNNITIFENYDITIKGNIIVQESGLLILKNTTIKISQLKANQYGVIVKGKLEASFSSIIPDPLYTLSYNITVKGNGVLSLSNSNITRPKAVCQLILEDFGVIIGDKVNILEGFIIAKNYSSLKLTNSKIDPASSKIPIVSYDFSDISLIKTAVTVASTKPLFELYGSSRLSFSDYKSASGIIRAYNYSKLDVRSCERDLSIELYHSSSAIINSGEFKSLKAYNSSMASIIKTMSSMGTEINTYDSSTVLLHSGRATSLFAFKNSRLSVINSVIDYTLSMSGGVVGAYDSANVFLDGSTVRILNADQSSTVSLSNVTIRWMARASTSSSLSFDKCKIETLSVTDASSVSVSNSNIILLEIINSPKVYIGDSTINEATFNFKSVNISIAGLGPIYCSYWSSTANGTLVNYAGGYGADITLNKTSIQYGLNLRLFGSSNVSIIDSKLNHLGMYDSTTVYLTNSTAASYYIGNDTEMFTYWYLGVFALNGTNLTVLYQNGTAATPTVTVSGDFVKFSLLEKVVNGSIIYKVSNYILNAEWEGGSAQRTIEISGNVMVDLTPPKPWQPDITLIASIVLLICAVLGISLFYLKKRKRLSKGL